MTTDNGSRKGLFTNFFSLSAVQIAGYIIPLITVPYIFRTIGTDKFGLFSFAGAFGSYFQVLLDYGFNLSGIRDVSKNRHDKKELSSIVSGIMSAKIILLSSSIIFAGAAIFLVPRFHQAWPVYFLSIIASIGSSFLPSWFFQGIEKMKILAILNLGSRIISMLLMFILIKKPDDFMTLLYLSAASSWIVAVIGIVFMLKKVYFQINLHAGIVILKSCFGLFTSQFWACILQTSNTFVLGFFVDNKEVGIYAAAEKITKAVICMGIPLCASIYPRSSILFKHSADSAYRFLRKVLLVGGLFMALMSILLFSFAPMAAAFVTGHPAPDVTLLIRILSILPFTIFIDNIYGTQILLNIGLEKQVIRSVAISAIMTLLLLVSLIPFFGPIGAALSFLFSEFLVLILMGIALWQTGISPILSIRYGKG
jgi:polysaccharide transporter, PST family